METLCSIMGRRRRERDLLATAGRVVSAVDGLKLEAALLASEQQSLRADVVEMMRLLLERGEVSPSVDAVLLVAEASVEASARPLVG